jgi:DNA repair exonuclease SbcCD ATPase subunit
MGKRKEQDYMDSLADIEQKYGRYREQVEQQAINDHRAIEELERECDQKDRKIEQLEQKLSSSESATQQIRSDMAIVRDKW